MTMMRLGTSLFTVNGWGGLAERRTTRPWRPLPVEMRVPVPVRARLPSGTGKVMRVGRGIGVRAWGQRGRRRAAGAGGRVWVAD